MDLTYPAEAEAFRKEIRGWLDENLPERWSEPGFELSGEERVAFNERWPVKLYEGGWICASWPKEYGGKGLSTMENVVLAEEFARAGAPLRADFFGDTLVGPTLLQWGTEEQKKEFLPKILSGQIRWCQGFSEPDSGSDLASLKTSAVLDGEEWVINGQKVWTTQAQHADYAFLLARTDPDAPKHKGISYLLVPMRQPGVEVRPIVQPDGTAEFNEVFLDGARCPKDNVVGGVNNGWQVANTTLGFERGSSATTSYRRFEKELEQIIERAREIGVAEDPRVRQRLVKAYTTVQIMKVNGWRSLTAALREKRDPGVAALGASNKMFWSEYHREVMELAMDLWGLDGLVLTGADDVETWPGVMRGAGRPGYPVNPMQQAFFFSRSETIWGGTAEIQRNIVGERVLGLPPRAEGCDRHMTARVVPYGPAPSQHLEVWTPAEGAGPWPVAVLLHGGYWRDRYDLHLMDGLAADLAGRGWLVANAEYRRVGDDGGGWPATFDDVRSTVEAAAGLPGADPSRVVVIGHSAGGQLALWAASQRPLAAVVALAPVSDLQEASARGLSDHAVHGLLGGPPAEHPDRYAAADPMRRLPLRTPTLVVHGDADVNVPVDLSQAYVAAALAAGDDVTYVEPAGGDHFVVIDATSAAWAAVVDWLG